ncbi:MAG: thiamine pyrophosphate-binding protein [Candidatus Margulisbacteria bacterium]|jgi:acetolactate synthase-1/2/3 large subunit|nr:thiamine pyrophosphate-binding protein [Candidatus Margulisiibacteriota bacterium]
MARLVEYGVRDLFMISGGGAMHLVDSVGRNKKLKYLCPHHEQAAAIAAEGYARVSGKMGVVVVTSGPGGTNTLTGVIGQWLDSVPCLYLSGQVKFETTIASSPELKLRQLGDQEINIVDIVKPVTKYAVMVKDPKTIRYHLEWAIYLATHGRPGPVWLDIPLNVQAALIEPAKLPGFKPPAAKRNGRLSAQLDRVAALIARAKRPVIVAGNGIRLAGATKEFYRLARKLGFPLLATFNGFDLLPNDHPLYIGRIGTLGDRAGNFALQNADLVLEIGTRNNIRQVSYNWRAFARAATKVVVDIDPAELRKPTVRPDLAIAADAKEFISALDKKLGRTSRPEWLAWCRERRERYPVVQPEYRTGNGPINPYHFVEALTAQLRPDDVVVAGNGTACVALFQAGQVKKGERHFWNSGCASMGYDLPAAIGAAVARGGKRVICLAGDGSLQMNIQELQTLAHYRLPVKLFVLNNQGYVSIKQTQDSFFGGHRVACCPATGVSCPDSTSVARGYGLKSAAINGRRGLSKQIARVLAQPGPVVCDVGLLADYHFAPKLSSARLPDGRLVSKPLEDLFPFLARDEFRRNMIVPEWRE